MSTEKAVFLPIQWFPFAPHTVRIITCLEGLTNGNQIQVPHFKFGKEK